MKSTLLNFVLFQAAWFGCVLSAAAGAWWVPPVCACVACGVHLAQSASRVDAASKLGIITALGTAIDVAIWKLGVVQFSAEETPIIFGTLWFASLWASFATTLRSSLGWLHKKVMLAVAFGAIGGPLAYLGASRLKAVAFPSTATAMVVFALEWAILTPLVLMIAHRAAKKEQSA